MIKAYSLYEGSYSVDKTKVFIPFDPEKDDPKDRPGSLFIHVHPFLVETSGGLALLDAGLGHRGDDGKLLILHNVKRLGFDPDDVKFVLLSHLHKDHISGAVDLQASALTFPNATYYVQDKEWEDTFSSKADDDDKKILRIIEESGQLTKLEGDGKINDEIAYELTGGHTTYHQVYHIESGGEHYFFGGDVLPEPEEIFRSFVAKYDVDGKRSRDLRAAFWAKGAPAEWVFLFYHAKTIQIGQSEKKDNGEYKLVDVATNN